MPKLLPNEEEEDIGGDISQFEKPRITVERYVDEVNPQFGTQVARSQEDWIKELAKKRGESLIQQIEQLGRRFGDTDGDRIMDLARRELLHQLHILSQESLPG